MASTQHHYEVLTSNGDRADSDTLEGILLAGVTLACEARQLSGVHRPTLTLLRDGRCVLADVTPAHFARVGKQF